MKIYFSINSSKSIMAIAPTQKSLIRFELLCIWCGGKGPTPIFACAYQVVPAPFLNILFFHALNNLGALVENQMTMV